MLPVQVYNQLEALATGILELLTRRKTMWLTLVAEESALLVRLNYKNDIYYLHTPGLDVCDHPPAAFSSTQSDYMRDKEKWEERS